MLISLINNKDYISIIENPHFLNNLEYPIFHLEEVEKYSIQPTNTIAKQTDFITLHKKKKKKKTNKQTFHVTQAI